MLDFLEIRAPMFRPLWLRVVLTLAVLAWAGVEASNGATAWAVVFALAAGWLAFRFFVTWDGGHMGRGGGSEGGGGGDAPD